MDAAARLGRATDSAKVLLRGVAKTFNTRHGPVAALEPIDLEIQPGEFIVIVGPSGCGKSTLLRILAGLEKASSGTMEIRQAQPGRPVNAMVFQERSVFPWMNVWDNVAYGLKMRGVPLSRIKPVVDRYIEQIGLTPFAKAYPHQLSGGMKQRVGVARGFATDPEILLMDEPFAALDEQNKVLLQQELLRIWEATRKTVVFITHSIDEALILADRVLIMSARPGRVKMSIPVDFPRPRSVMELRANPQYGQLVKKVWGLLEEEVLRATGGGGR